jgi:uncharacterized membrane protein YkoI
MKTSTKIVLASAVMSIFGIGAVVKIVNASPATKSIAVSQISAEETNDDQQEDKKLQALAKITAEQAKQAAETFIGAKASSVNIENEDGNLVYAVKLAEKEVEVDAGNGKVIYIENLKQENKDDEVSRPKSSIQVKENNNEEETNEGSK